MNVRFYFDVHVPGPVFTQLQICGVDVVRAQDDDRGEASDPELLDRAAEVGRVLVTFDQDFLAEAHRRQENGLRFGGIIFGHGDVVSVGQMVEDLTLIDQCMEQDEFESKVLFLPL